MMGGSIMDSSESRYRPLAWPCDYSNELADSIKCREFLD
jgi:hypothetical protein